MFAVLHWLDAPLTAPYRWTMLGAIVISACYWSVKARRDPALLPVFAHLGLALLLGLYIPPYLDTWFREAVKMIVGQG